MPYNDQYVGFTDPNAQGAMAPLQNNAVNAQANNASGMVNNAGGAAGGSNWLTGNLTTTTGLNGSTTTTGQPGFFQKGGGASLALGAVQTLGSLWNSVQQNKMAKKSFALQEESYRTNLGNQTKTYNTALEDRINARYATEGRSGEAAGYIEKNKL